VSATQGVERLTANGFIAGGQEHAIDCLICASGFEVTSDLDRRWGIAEIRGRGGRSLYDWWAEGYRTLHGIMTHGFPNLFFTGYVQGGLYATTTEQFNRQGQHIAYVVKESLARGAAAVQPSLEAQDAWVTHLRATAFPIEQMQADCPPSYLNNEGGGKFRYYLGEFYGPGWHAFQKILEEWRGKGDMEGLVLER